MNDETVNDPIEDATQVDQAEVQPDAAEGMDWYVVQAFSNYEKRVQLALQERIDRGFAWGCKSSLVKYWCRLKKWLRCVPVRNEPANVSSILVMFSFR